MARQTDSSRSRLEPATRARILDELERDIARAMRRAFKRLDAVKAGPSC
jgi:hypothetical protein